ncbi:MAG: hypothetical protein VB109_14365 [Desulfitobacterium hafniense]|nr:hypothetical protein [Desulfitobacterium hafniense]
MKVVFSQAVDKTSAETFANYTFNALDSQASPATVGTAAKLQEDGKTVLLTVDNPLAKRYQVKTTGILAKDGVKTFKNYNQIINFVADTTAPTATVERVSANKLKVKFTEPVKAATPTYVYADGTVINWGSGSAPLISAGATELVIDLSDAAILVNKDIIVTLNGVADMAGNLINPQPTKLTVVKQQVDGIEPALTSVTQTGAKTFTIKFSKDLDGNLVFGDVTLTGGANTTAIEKISASEYEFTTDNNLDGLQTVTVAAGKAVDLAGQGNTSSLTKLVTFKADTVAPKATAKLVTDKNNKEVIELTLDKAVDLAGSQEVAVSGSYVKDYVTTTVPATNVVAAYADGTGDIKTKVHISLATAPLNVEGAKYDLEIVNKTAATDGIVSEAGVAMDKAKVAFTRGKDGDAANTDVVTNVVVAQGADNNKVTITFTIPLGAKLEGTSATNVANYSIAGAVIESIDLAAASGTSQVATLNLKKDSNTFTGVRNIIVKDVKIAGSTKVMDPVTISNVPLNENVRPTVSKAELTAALTITVTFSENVINAAAAVGDFDLYIGGVKDARTVTTALQAAATGAVLELTLDSPVTADDVAKGLTIKAASTLDITDGVTPVGNKVFAPDAITVTN